MLKKIYDALEWLKSNNWLYKDIHLTDYNSLQNVVTNMMNEDIVIEEKYDIEGTDIDTVEKISRPEHNKALISQRSLEDQYNQQFTIHCLNESRKNDKDTEFYQMLRIKNDPIKNFEDLQLDLKCFPHILHTLKMVSKISIKKISSEFVKAQLMSMNSSFRKELQYLFFLLHESNLRALKAGIYQKIKYH